MAVQGLLRIGILPGFVVLLGGFLARAIERDIAAAGDRIIGYADRPGVADDIIDYFAAPGVIGETV